MNFFNINPTPSNHVGTVCYTRKTPFSRPLDSRFGCVASEGGAPFVARRAMNLHGCALPHCAPRSSYGGGTPGSVVSPGVGRPPSCGDSAGPSRWFDFRAVFPYARSTTRASAIDSPRSWTMTGLRSISSTSGCDARNADS